MFESLESRRLLAATVTATFADGSQAIQNGTLLTVNSGNGIANFAVVENLNGTMGDGNFTVINNQTGEMADFFGIAQRVKINGGPGDDVLVYNGTTLPCDIAGVSGEDDITVRDLSANGGDIVNGGSGNDLIVLVCSESAYLKGDGGDDIFEINTGSIDDAVIFDYSGSNTTIECGGGADLIYIYDGRGSADGNGGSDTVVDEAGGTAIFTYKSIETVIIV